jgi:4-hydroxy-2-oxoheptanedioate aldolase
MPVPQGAWSEGNRAVAGAFNRSRILPKSDRASVSGLPARDAPTISGTGGSRVCPESRPVVFEFMCRTAAWRERARLADRRGRKIARTCGYSSLFMDLEHAAMSLDAATQVSVAALDAGISPLVRVPAGQYWMATRALDGGALRIIMPHVNTPDEAREIVARVEYPPLGQRSVSAPMAQTDFRSIPVAEVTSMMNRGSLTIVMPETREAIANADPIAAVDGIDVLLIGTNDLAAEMGIPGNVADPRITAAYERVISACRKHGKWPAMGGVYAEDLLRKFVGMGGGILKTENDAML